MTHTQAKLKSIYDRTSGYCHICGKKLSFTNYGKLSWKGAWEVEHSRARSNGGSDHGNNLFASCIPCNREKGTLTTRTARSWHDRTRAPLSREKRTKARTENTVGGGLLGAVSGGLIGGPVGAVIGALTGAALGRRKNPDKK